MYAELAVLLVTVPLLFLLVGSAQRKSILAVAGSIGLIIVGTLILASPIVMVYGVNSTSTSGMSWNCTAANGTDTTCSNQTMNYTYLSETMPENDNLVLGMLLAFVGLAGLAYSASVSFK